MPISRSSVAAIVFAGLSLPTSLHAQAVNVDVNGPRIILRSAEPRDWSNVTVLLNDWWMFKAPAVPRMNSLCINASAFVVKAGVRGDFEGIHFDPSTMKVKTVSVSAANGTAIPLRSGTAGMIKPLASQEAALTCVGSINHRAQ
jgi:hypothetical protein